MTEQPTEGTPPAPRRTGREAVLVLGAGVLAAGFLLLAVGRTWASFAVATPGVPRYEEALTGRDLAPAALGFGLAALAGVLAVLATRGWGRRVAGAVVALCGAGSAVATAVAVGFGGTVRHEVAFSGLTVEADYNAWPVLTMVAAVLCALAGAVTVWRGPRWPGMGARYEAPRKREREQEPDMWRAFDRGDDPTA